MQISFIQNTLICALYGNIARAADAAVVAAMASVFGRLGYYLTAIDIND